MIDPNYKDKIDGKEDIINEETNDINNGEGNDKNNDKYKGNNEKKNDKNISNKNNNNQNNSSHYKVKLDINKTNCKGKKKKCC